jgi:hypothetical protein
MCDKAQTMRIETSRWLSVAIRAHLPGYPKRSRLSTHSVSKSASESDALNRISSTERCESSWPVGNDLADRGMNSIGIASLTTSNRRHFDSTAENQSACFATSWGKDKGSKDTELWAEEMLLGIIGVTCESRGLETLLIDSLVTHEAI